MSGYIHFVLLRKEIRQLLPLLIAILGLALICYVGVVSLPAQMRLSMLSPGYILLAIPSLFAVGAGAMSISQEKETRTLGWLSSLPLSSKRLSMTKFFAALICWGLLWHLVVLLCMTIEALQSDFILFVPESSQGHPIRSIWLSYWVLNSLYLLVCGFLTSWYFGTSMASLVTFVPLAVAPTFVRTGLLYATHPGYALSSSQYDPTLLQCIISIGVLLLPAIWLTNRFAMRSLAPKQDRVSPNPYASASLCVDTTNRSTQSVLSPSSAMLWHFYRQNRAILWCLCGTSLAVVLPSLLFSNTAAYIRSGWESIAFASIFIMTSWFGVLAFQADNLNDRIRFIAERGVAPGKAWLIRQLFPFAYVCSVSLLFALFRYHSLSLAPGFNPPPVWLVFWFLFTVLAYSQWFAQWVKNPILSAIGGPLVGAMGLGFCAYSREELDASVVLIALITVAPFIATLAMMRCWMDRRMNWQYWARHLAIVFIVVAIPVVSAIWRIQRTPRMAAGMKSALREEAKSIKPNASVYVSLDWLNEIELDEFGNASLENRVKFAAGGIAPEQIATAVERIVEESSSLGIQMNSQDIERILRDLRIDRYELDENPDDPEKLKSYQARVKLFATLARGLRQSNLLMSQEQADAVEIALIVELRHPDAQRRLGPDAWDRYAGIVSNSKARSAARRRAVLSGWQDFESQLFSARSSFAFGNFYADAYYLGFPNLIYRWTQTRRVEHLASTLVRLLDVGPTATEAEKIALLRTRWATSTNEIDIRRAHPWTRVGTPIDYVSIPNTLNLPGDQWFGEWEKVGDSLTSEIP